MNKLAKEIHEIAKSKGFYDNPKNTGEVLMKVVRELSEALDADQNNRNLIEQPNLIYTVLEYLKFRSLKNKFKKTFELNIKNTFEDEIADSIMILLDLCAAKNIDIETHIKLKMEYNKTRKHLHGKRY